MSERFSFEDNFVARRWLVRAGRHIAQSVLKYNPETGIAIIPPKDSPYWIIERRLVLLESEFELAKAAKDKRKSKRKRAKREKSA